ncbi:MAG TPA: RNA polymerase sigma factor [Terriglobales bacterium]|nr:RNA polymerase sigma factor [Terriglobales bacterium]
MCCSGTICHDELKCATPTTPRVEDAALIRDAQRGCKTAFETLVRRYDHAILRLALRLTGSEHDAQDIYQDAFLKAYKNIGKFRSESSFYTWMHRIVTNLCMDRMRSKHFVRETGSVTLGPDGQATDLFDHIADTHTYTDPECQVLRKEVAKHIGNALKRLTARERLVFQLKHYEALKLRTIGNMLNTSEETAKNTLFRATHKLRKYLAHVDAQLHAKSKRQRSGSMA